jgi:hypothetical protein
MCQELINNLTELKILLQQEREYTKNLQFDSLHKILQKKISLLSHISLFPSNKVDKDQQNLLQAIAGENRRNARLLCYVKKQLRQRIAFYFSSSPCLQYSNCGTFDKRLVASQLISGKV